MTSNMGSNRSNYLGSLSVLTPALQVSLHGSGLTNGLFLPAGSAVVEVLCWNFAGTWPDSYYKQSFEYDQSVKSGFFRLVADKDHCFAGEFEQRGIGKQRGSLCCLQSIVFGTQGAVYAWLCTALRQNDCNFCSC